MKKINTPLAKIIVEGTAYKPYYEILYIDPSDGSFHIGFGSYNIENVFQWLADEFEIVDAEEIERPVFLTRKRQSDMRLIDADAFEKWAWKNSDITVDGDKYILVDSIINFADDHSIDAVPDPYSGWDDT